MRSFAAHRKPNSRFKKRAYGRRKAQQIFLLKKAAFPSITFYLLLHLRQMFLLKSSSSRLILCAAIVLCAAVVLAAHTGSAFLLVKILQGLFYAQLRCANCEKKSAANLLGSCCFYAVKTKEPF